MHIVRNADGSTALIFQPKEVGTLIEILMVLQPSNEESEQALQRSIEQLLRGNNRVIN